MGSQPLCLANCQLVQNGLEPFEGVQSHVLYAAHPEAEDEVFYPDDLPCFLLRLDCNTSEYNASCALKVMLQMAVPLRGFDRSRLGPLEILCLFLVRR